MVSVKPRLTPLGARITALSALLGRLAPVPPEWLSADDPSNSRNGSGGLYPAPCTSWTELVGAWRKALRWTEGLDRALSVMLASVLSTRIVGDQLWIKVIGPPACGKSTLCEAISINTEYVIAKSTIRGFHSGFKGDGGEDHSLIARIGGKTLVTKDGDTLLQSPNLGQILSEARDLYDSVSRTHYRNAMSNDYSGIRMTWLLCGTSSLRSIDSSELGERFLDCVIMEGIDDDLEDEILWRVVNRTDRNMIIEANGDLETHYEPALAHAMRLTGGYVSYLRENAVELLSNVETSEEVLRLCARLGKFVSHMRARPTARDDGAEERELGARLGSQHMRLAKCLAAVLNAREIDEEVVRRVKRVAFDTSRGLNLELVEKLLGNPLGLEMRALANLVNATDDVVRTRLRFLKRLNVLERNEVPAGNGAKTMINRWRLTDRFVRLYNEVRQ